MEQRNIVKNNDKNTNENSDMVNKDQVKKDSQKVNNLSNEDDNMIIDIEMIENMIITIKDSKDYISLQSHILARKVV